jgi:hypothetical protein
MPDASPNPSLVNLGQPQDFEDLVSKLDDEDLRKVLAGDSSDVSGKMLIVKNATATDAWRVFKLVHLLNAAAHLAFPSTDRIAVASEGSEPFTHESGPPEEVPSLLDILRTARSRDQIRKAICRFRAGGPEGLFDAYEALSYELMSCGASDYTRDVGTREWLAENGWATEEEIDRFLETVLCARCDLNSPVALESMSPPAAQALVRRLLLKFIRHSTAVIATSSDAPYCDVKRDARP